MDRIRAPGLKATTAFNPPRLSSRDLISRIPQNRDDVFSETVVGLDHQDFLGFIVLSFVAFLEPASLRNNRGEVLGETWLRRRAH
jgi:hypothetical protein